MKVPLSWLKEFVDVPVSPEELERRLTLAGMEVVELTYLGVDGSELPWDPNKILICNILEVTQHPNADRLVLAEVDYGGAQPHTVVTGAPNLFPYKGQGRLSHPLKAVFAKEGSRLYDGHVEGKVITTLKGRPVRGVMSDAMLCSEKELGISEEHDGIILLEDDAPVGVPLRDFMGEVVLTIDFTPNYGRCLSIVGVAREVAALLGSQLHLPTPQAQMDGPALAGRANVTIEEPDLCPRFTVGLIEGVTIGQSPQWMQRRLINAGMRPINVVVDVSNYVMLEWGQPTHAFDADKVQDRHLIVRNARAGERLLTLDGKDRDLSPGAESGLSHTPLLVCDQTGPLGLAGVMGGETSEVRDHTTTILLEAAIWEPLQIRRTARGLKIPSEASRRYERGVDYALPIIAQHRALELIRTLAGGTIAAGLVDNYPRPWQTVVLDLTPSEIERIVGIHLSAEEIAGILRSLSFECELLGGGGSVGDFALMNVEPTVRVTVPSFRQDVSIVADLCEEVARIYGYDKIPETRMADELPPPYVDPSIAVEQRVRDLLVGMGLSEIITHSLINMELVAKVDPAEAVAERYMKLANPSTPERVYLRRSLLPSVLDAVAMNLRERERIALFEIGRRYLPKAEPSDATGWLPDEPRSLAISLVGPRTLAGWSGAAGAALDFFDLKGLVETLIERLGLTSKATYLPLSDDPRFHPGRSAALHLNLPDPNAEQGKKQKGPPKTVSLRVGVFGEVHPAVRDRLGVGAQRVVAAELDLDSLIAHVAPDRYASISRFPAVVQDLAVVAPVATPAAQIAEVITRNGGDLLESVELFDLYTGPQVGEGNRSLAYRLSFRAGDRTLNDEAVTKVRAKIIKALEREAGATIRG